MVTLDALWQRQHGNKVAYLDREEAEREATRLRALSLSGEHFSVYECPWWAFDGDPLHFHVGHTPDQWEARRERTPQDRMRDRLAVLARIPQRYMSRWQRIYLADVGYLLERQQERQDGAS